MADVVVQGLCQVFQNGSGSYLAVLQMIYAEPLEVAYMEMTVEFLAGKILGKDPVIQFTQAVTGAERLLKLPTTASLNEGLLGCKV